MYENYDVPNPFKSAAEQLDIEKAKKGESSMQHEPQSHGMQQSLAKRPMTSLPKYLP